VVKIFFITRPIERCTDTQMGAYEITKLTAELKDDNIKYRNESIYIIVVVLQGRIQEF